MTTRPAIQRFEIREVLGDGGMGIVYRAHDPQLERDVAIKVLHAPTAQARSELATTRTVDLRGRAADQKRDDLLHEARMMARLSHPNVVPIYEVGLDDAGVFVVMEYVAGVDVRKWLETTRSTPEVLAMFAQAARGLAAAHDRGIVHRDFKPDNVLIGTDGRARVTDFGIARLADPGALVRVAKVAGTPKYMAPELWDGEPGTRASDIYAFSASLLEALGADARHEAAELERKLGERLGEPLRSVVRAGIARDPAKRPDIAQLIAALEGRAPRRRALVVALGIAGSGAVLAAALVMRGSGDGAGDDPTCTEDAALFAGRWDDAKRDALRSHFAATPQPPDPAQANRLLGLIDRRATEIAALRRTTCEATNRRELTAIQASGRQACLERRAIEVGVIVDHQLATTSSASAVEIRLNRAAPPIACDVVQVPPPTVDARALEELYARLVRSADIATDAEAVAELTALERAARTAGDRELAARAAVLLGLRLRNTDQLKASDEVLQRAYADAIAVGSTDAATSALAERCWTLANSADMVLAKSVGALALDLAMKPTTTLRTRMRLFRVLGRGELVRGQYRSAIEQLRKALELATSTDERNPDVEILIRIDLTDALIFVGGAQAAAIAFAHESVELARAHGGERSVNHGVLLALLAKAYIANRDVDKALPHLRQALAVFEATHPPGHSRRVAARGELGAALMLDSQFEAAHDELAGAVKLAETNEGLRRSHPHLLSQLAQVTFELGRHEDGVQMQAQAVELLTSTHGAEHPQTLGQRYQYAGLLYELGRLEEAERVVGLLELAYQRRPGTRDHRLALLRGTLSADLAIARGRARDAEKIVRLALEELAELGAEVVDLAHAERRLGESLLAQRRFDEALPLLGAAFETARTNRLRADELAYFELPLARAEYAHGRQAEALARADRLRTVLERYPGARIARDQVSRLLAERKGPPTRR